MEYLLIALIALIVPFGCLLTIGVWVRYWSAVEEVMDIKKRIKANQ